MERKELTFIDLAIILLRKKWVFIITFIIIFVAIFAYFYIRPDEYTVDAKIKIAEDYMGDNNQLYGYYPEEMDELWIFPTHKRVDSERKNLEIIADELDSDEIIAGTEKYLGDNYGISIDDLRNTFAITVDSSQRDITISATYDEPEASVKIAESLLDVYIMAKQDHFEGLYISFLDKLVIRTDEDSIELERLNDEKNNYEAKYYIANTGPVEERDVDYMGELLTKVESTDRQMAVVNTDYKLFKKVKENLENNKEFFINKIEIIQEPEISNIVSNEVSLRRSIAYSGLLSLLIAFILTFIVGIASYARYTRMH